jgi:mannose-6-phosphate isomerase
MSIANGLEIIMLVESDNEIVTESRPWGKFERFTLNEPSTVKLVYVQSGKRLSLQYHNKRTEFWKVIKGPVTIQIGKEVRILMTGHSITIPEGTVHRLIGMDGVPQAVVLEISFGEFDEADIVRLEDDYSRKVANKASVTI